VFTYLYLEYYIIILSIDSVLVRALLISSAHLARTISGPAITVLLPAFLVHRGRSKLKKGAALTLLVTLLGGQ